LLENEDIGFVRCNRGDDACLADTGEDEDENSTSDAEAFSVSVSVRCGVVIVALGDGRDLFF
jgi:hypothetical protein